MLPDRFLIHLHPGPNLGTKGRGSAVSSADLSAYFRSATRPDAKLLLAVAKDLIAMFSEPANEEQRRVLDALRTLSEPDIDMVLVERIDHNP